MMIRDESFYDHIYRLFYRFSNAKPEQVGISFSKQTIYPVLQTKPDIQIIIPLPKKLGEDYIFEGLLFENTDKGKKSLWALFLATLYHLAAHAAISDYSNYEVWAKNKNEDLCWLVVDFIEDIKIQKYIEHSDQDVWHHICEIESKFEDGLKKSNKDNQNAEHMRYHKDEDDKILELIKTKILENSVENKKELLDIANFLYNNRNLLQPPSLPNRERHELRWQLKFDKCAPSLCFSGILEEQIQQLDDLWKSDEFEKTRLFRKYKKHMKNLHFDNVVIPTGNLQTFSQIKSNTLPMLRKIRQQIRMVTNLVDEPRIEQIGYVDMQMAIQAIASEGQLTDIFERDEPRRREEAWVILVDKSASMNLRCQELKEFVVCVAESANELTGKSDAWAIYSFDTDFHIIKDFKERYNQEVQARIGAINRGGLTLLPDALNLTNKILNEDPRERKYIFLISDGSPSGYDNIHEAFTKVVKKTDVSETILISIGVSKGATRIFRNGVRGKDLKTLVAKFITAYRSVASSDM